VKKFYLVKPKLTVQNMNPQKAKFYYGQPVYYEQDRPKFKSKFVHNGKRYSGWFLFDTGREGTMLVGEDITGQNNNWKELKELMIANGRKVIRLDAIIAKTKIKDIVTNAADPASPQGRPSLFGNQILNHFNVILDNQDGWLYLKPNNRSGEPYSDYKNFLQQAC
jgi:predicted aspartyl protease